MAAPVSVDVLVVGSGASGLAAAVSAQRARAACAVAAKGSLQSCNSAKAQGRIQAAFGDDDSPEQHAEDVWRSSHETADRRLVEVLTGEAPGAIHWLEELGVQFTRENGGYRLAKCGGASRKRLLQVGDRTGHAITAALRDAVQASSVKTFSKSPLSSLERAENGWRARCGEHVIDAGAVVLAAGGRCYREAEERGELSTNHPGATGEVTQIALDLGAESRDLDALQYHPNGGAWPANMQGYSIPETTRAYGATLLNVEREEFADPLGPRDEVSQAIFDEVGAGRGVETPDGRIAVYTCRVGEHFPLHPTRIYEALKHGTERTTVEHPLRSNAVHTITRENTGPNTGYRLPIVHWEFIPDWDGLDVKCVPKGSGSENMSFLKMCVPADGVKGIKQFVLESIVDAGGKPCPPGIVGVGIGGSADYAMYLAKEAIARPVGTKNADPHVAKLEEELFELLNETGIGPMGLGGDVTVLQVHVEHADTHMTLNPVAVNYQCWAARRASAHISADGDVDYDREF